MLKALFKPKWRHNDPQVRLRALQAMDASCLDNRAVLQEAAINDSVALVRRAAINRVNNLDVLWGIMQNETDAETRTSARHRFIALLTGADPESPPLEARLQQLTAVIDQKIFDEIACRGVESRLRLDAVQRIEREALLGDIALNDKDAGVRVAAVGRITKKSTLERVAKNARTKDKRVSGVAREKLEKLAAETDRPALLQQRARNICITLTALVQSNNVADAQERMRSTDTEWTEILNDWDHNICGAFDSGLMQRYSDTRSALVTLLEKNTQIVEKKRNIEVQRAVSCAHKINLCVQLEIIAADLEKHTVPDVNCEEGNAAAIHQIQKEWIASGDLNINEQHSLRTRYLAAMSRIESYLSDAARFFTAQKKYADLLARSQAMLDSVLATQESDIKALYTMRNNIVQPQHYILDVTINQRLDEAFSQLNTRHGQIVKKINDDVERFKILVNVIEKAATEGLSKQAIDLLRETKQIYAALPQHESGILCKQGYVNRWQTAEKTIRELWSWKKWAGAPVKERLVDEMEALARTLYEPGELEHDYLSISREIHKARDQWKSLGVTDNAAARQLWERFNKACEVAYAPCEAFFKAKHAERAGNAQQKKAICDNIEQFIVQTDWENAEWRNVERILHDARVEWSRVGLTGRAQSKTLSKRFNALMDDLTVRLAGERKLNKSRKEALIKRMEDIADSLQNITANSTSIQDAVAQVRKLQLQWKTLGASTDSAELWNRFRTACDSVFAHRQVLHRAQDQALQSNFDLKYALCTQIEELTQLQGDDLLQARSRLQHIKNEFEGSGPVAKKDACGIQQRFFDVCQAFEQQERVCRAQVRDQEIQLFQKKVQLCTELDKIISALIRGFLAHDDAEAQMRSTQDSWRTLAPLEDAIEKRIVSRFQCMADTLQGLLGADRVEFIGKFAKIQQENLVAKELLCIRAEIAAEIDSPTEYCKQRMALQVDQLTRRLREGESGIDNLYADAEVLMREWELIGAAPGPINDTLQERFNRVLRVLLG